MKFWQSGKRNDEYWHMKIAVRFWEKVYRYFYDYWDFALYFHLFNFVNQAVKHKECTGSTSDE